MAATEEDPHPWSLSGHAPLEALREQGFALLAPEELASLSGVATAGLQDWLPQWDRLPPDEYLRDGGRYRFRRHGCYILEVADGVLTRTPHRPHWQSTDYNALHGGIDRWFAPLEEELATDPRWTALLRSLGAFFAEVGPVERWYIEAHQFRIDAAGGLGRPTPEGAHRDGVDFVAVIVVNRSGVRGGETRVFQADGPLGMRFVIDKPWSALLLDDAHVIHETTPIQPEAQASPATASAAGRERSAPSDPDDPVAPPAVRDTLVLTYRRGGFQSSE